MTEVSRAEHFQLNLQNLHNMKATAAAANDAECEKLMDKLLDHANSYKRDFLDCQKDTTENFNAHFVAAAAITFGLPEGTTEAELRAYAERFDHV